MELPPCVFMESFGARASKLEITWRRMKKIGYVDLQPKQMNL